jgi:hypothetical protein
MQTGKISVVCLFIAIGLIVVLTLLFVGGRIWARRTHFAFEPKDVAAAIETLLDDSPHSMDNWDLFLSWPIKDPYCEHIRQECIRAIDEHPPVRNDFVSDEAARRIAALLEDVKLHMK